MKQPWRTISIILLSAIIGAIGMYFFLDLTKPKVDTELREFLKSERDSLNQTLNTYLRDSIPAQMARISEIQRLETVINNYYKENKDETVLYTPSQVDSALLSRFSNDLARYRSERTTWPDR